MEHLGREIAPTEPTPIPKAPSRTTRLRAALDQPTLLHRPVSAPVRVGSPRLSPVFTKRESFSRSLPDSLSNMDDQPKTRQPLDDLANLGIGVLRVAVDQMWGGSADLAVEGLKSDGALVFTENREHSDVPVRILR